MQVAHIYAYMGGFIKLGVPLLGVAIIGRTISFWNLYWGPAYLNKTMRSEGWLEQLNTLERREDILECYPVQDPSYRPSCLH